MSNHDVSVTQLRSGGISFLNVIDGDGWIGVTAYAYARPTLLIRDGNHVTLMQFDSEGWMREWLEENSKDATIEHLDDIQKRVP